MLLRITSIREMDEGKTFAGESSEIRVVFYRGEASFTLVVLTTDRSGMARMPRIVSERAPRHLYT